MNRKTVIILGYFCLLTSFMYDVQTELSGRLLMLGLSLGFFIRSAYLGIKESINKKDNDRL